MGHEREGKQTVSGGTATLKLHIQCVYTRDQVILSPVRTHNSPASILFDKLGTCAEASRLFSCENTTRGPQLKLMSSSQPANKILVSTFCEVWS